MSAVYQENWEEHRLGTYLVEGLEGADLDQEFAGSIMPGSVLHSDVCYHLDSWQLETRQ